MKGNTAKEDQHSITVSRMLQCPQISYYDTTVDRQVLTAAHQS